MSSFLFVCGFPSSGTELLKLMLRAHPDVWLADEFPFLPDVIELFGNPVPASKVAAVEKTLRRLDIYGHLAGSARRYSADAPEPFADVYQRLLVDDPPRYIGNKTPQYTEWLSTIAEGFPSARVIMLVRDVRDVCASWVSKWGKSPTLCARKWTVRMLEGADVLEHQFGDRGLTVRFEDLLADPLSECRRIGEFLDLEGVELMLEYNRVEQDGMDGKRNYGAPLDPSNTGKWRTDLPEKTATRVEEIAYEGLHCFGYVTELADGPKPITTAERILGRARDVTALITIGNRASQNRTSYKFEALRLELTKLWLRRFPK